MSHGKTPATERPHHHADRQAPAWKQLHRSLLTWIVVLLMLASMMMYVLSDDESLQPGGPPPAPTQSQAN